MDRIEVEAFRLLDAQERWKAIRGDFGRYMDLIASFMRVVNAEYRAGLLLVVQEEYRCVAVAKDNANILARVKRSSYWADIRNKPKHDDVTRWILQPLTRAYTKNGREKVYRHGLIIDMLMAEGVNVDEAAAKIAELGGVKQAFDEARRYFGRTGRRASGSKPDRPSSRARTFVQKDGAELHEEAEPEEDDWDTDDDQGQEPRRETTGSDRQSRDSDNVRHQTPGVPADSMILELQAMKTDGVNILSCKIVQLTVNVQPGPGFKTMLLHSFTVIKK